MVKKKSKRLAIQNGSDSKEHLRESIKKYCMTRTTKKSKNLHGKIKKSEYLRTKKKQSSIHTSTNNKNKKSKLNVPNDITMYEIKPLSPTKLSISVKKFYNNNNFKQYEENLQLFDKNKISVKGRSISKNKNCQHNVSRNVKHKSVLNNKKETLFKAKLKQKNHNCHKPYNLLPQLNKEQSKKGKKSDNKTKREKVYNKNCNFGNDKSQLTSEQTENLVTNETQTNECLVEEYKVTQSTKNALSISVKRFYKSKVASGANNNDNHIKDMPLVSDTTFNSKADFNQSPLSSKLNNSHKISLNVKHIKCTTDEKQQKVTAFFPIRRSNRKTKNIVIEEKQIALEKAIISQNEDGLKAEIFPDKGRGVVACRDFHRGEYVVEYSGELVCLNEARKRETIYSQDTSTGCYMYYFKHGSTHYCIDATAESSRLGRLVNHSRFGNLVTKVVEISGIPRLVLIAKNDIKQGQEITYDYGDRSKESLVNHPWLAY